MMPYRPYSRELKETFGEKVVKLSLATPTTCPNRDGTIDNKGCHFCDRFGSKAFFPARAMEISTQIQETMPALKKKFHANKFIAYLQTYTNTYGPIPFLREMYDRALDHPEIVGLDLATRPDCLEPEKLELLAEYSEKTHLSIELGVQSFREKSNTWTNRFHRGIDSLKAIQNLKSFVPKAKVIIHFILGLPGETYYDLYLNAYLANQLGVDGVKIHHLHILKFTQFHNMHSLDPISVLELEEYVPQFSYLLRHLHPGISIHRTHGVAPRHEELICPDWTKEKLRPTNILKHYMQQHRYQQGDLYAPKVFLSPSTLLRAGYPSSPSLMNH